MWYAVYVYCDGGGGGGVCFSTTTKKNPHFLFVYAFTSFGFIVWTVKA